MNISQEILVLDFGDEHQSTDFLRSDKPGGVASEANFGGMFQLNSIDKTEREKFPTALRFYRSSTSQRSGQAEMLNDFMAKLVSTSVVSQYGLSLVLLVSMII